MSVRASIIPGVPSLIIGVSPSPTPKGGARAALTPLTQVIGFVPLEVCGIEECRDSLIDEICYSNLVFGEIKSGVPTASASYENDVNTFLVNYSLALNNPLSSLSVTFYLQKLISNVWTTVATLDINLYGTYYKLGNSLFVNAGHKSYAGYQVNWGKVLHEQGEGCYRIRVESTFTTKNGASEITVKNACLESKIFKLLAWNCDRAHGTVKFEAFVTGRIGDVYQDYLVYDICGMSWYDSIRLYGFLGFETVPEYKELIHEYQTGLQRRIRDEAVQKFTLKTELVIKYILDRFKIYGLMSDTLWGSDYNINNSDYNIKRKSLIRASSFEPVYFDDKWRRMAKVEVDFKRGVQSVIKSICCEPKMQGAAG